DRPIWSDELERLTGSPAIQTAMKNAVTTGQDRAIRDGFGAFNPGVTVTPDGRLLMGQTYRGGAVRGVPTYPNIQYFDCVQRELADMASKAEAREPDRSVVAVREIDSDLDPFPAFGGDLLRIGLQLRGDQAIEQSDILQPAAIIVFKEIAHDVTACLL